MAKRSHQAVIGKAGKLTQRLDSYAAQNRRTRASSWPLYAAAAGSALAMATNASASIIYCGPGNNYCASNHAPNASAAKLNSFLAFQTQPGASHPGAASHDVVLNLDVFRAGISALASVQGANQIQIFDTSAVGSFIAKKFSSGDRIGAGLTVAQPGPNGIVQRMSTSQHNAFQYGNFVSGIPGFVGVAINNTAHSGTEYGWIRLMFTNTNSVPGLLQVVDWAVNTTANQSISAGQGFIATPEPGTLGLTLLAGGAAAIAALRRRRVASKPA